MRSKNSKASKPTGRLSYLLFCLLVPLSLTDIPLVAATENVQGMSRRIYHYIDDAQELIDAKQYAEAIPALQKIRARKLSDYERAVVLNMLGYVHYQQQEMTPALESYSEVLTLKRVPDSMIRKVLTTICQLHIVEGNYQLAEEYARQLLESRGRRAPPPSSSVILAQALIGQERYQEALEPLNFAIKKQRDAGSRVSENWLALLSSVYYNLEDFKQMRLVLYELIGQKSRKRYMINLASIHGQVGETARQLAVVEALHEVDRLSSETHLLALANLLLIEQLPYKAAVLLEKYIDSGDVSRTPRNLQLASQAWYLSGEYERSIVPLEEAARMSGDGELWLRSARLHVALYDWESAERAAKASLEKGGLKDKGSAMILGGMALTYQGKFNEAKNLFRRAGKTEGNKKWSRQWLDYIQNEQSRLRSIQ